MAKKAVDPEFKQERQDFDLFPALAAIDRKDYGYFATLTEEQQRKFVPYMMLHWLSSVQAKTVVAQYYVMSTNYHANTHMFNEIVSQHPQLQWMMLCASSPDMGSFRHSWVPHLSPGVTGLKKAADRKDIEAYFAKIYPKASADTLRQASSEYTSKQNHCFKLAEIYPNMKREDIEVLAGCVTAEDLKQYEADSGS